LADSKWLCHLGSDASPRTKTGKTPPPEPASYPAWKAAAAKELKDHHGIAATAIPEHDWTRFYVLRLTPSEAPDRAEREYRSRRPPEWLKSYGQKLVTA